LKEHLKTFGPLTLVAIYFVMRTVIGPMVWGRLAGPAVDETGVVTVIAHVGGAVGETHRGFQHLVRTASGTEHRMTFGELYPVGARLSVNYRRFVRGDAITVFFYNRVPD
jgi:hypothetical protein